MRPLSDYSFVRGVCYPGKWWRNDQATIERDMGYARKLQLNSTRIWLRYSQYWEDPAGYVDKLRNYIRTAFKFGITTMPVLWNGNMIDPSILREDYWSTGEKYIEHVVNECKGEEGIIMWDIMNEPNCNSYYRSASPEDEPARAEEFWRFLRHYSAQVKSLDVENATTIGHWRIYDVEPTADAVDVLAFHDYQPTRGRIESAYQLAEELSTKYGKPILNSELACLCRANPYDMALEICERHKMGWYLFELMVSGYWSEVHGIVYPDGTIRDPAIVAAIFGFYRNRDVASMVRPNPNKEGHVYRAIKLVEEALTEDNRVFRHQKKPMDDLLEAAEFCANLLEGCEMVPMADLPTAKILAWRQQPEEERDREAILDFSVELVQRLKKVSHVL